MLGATALALVLLSGCGSDEPDIATVVEQPAVIQNIEDAETIEAPVDDVVEEEPVEAPLVDWDNRTYFLGGLAGPIDGGYVLTTEGVFALDNMQTPVLPNETYEAFVEPVDVAARCGALVAAGELRGDALATGGWGMVRLNPMDGSVLWTHQGAIDSHNYPQYWESDDAIYTCSPTGYLLLRESSENLEQGKQVNYQILSLESGEIVRELSILNPNMQGTNEEREEQTARYQNEISNALRELADNYGFIISSSSANDSLLKEVLSATRFDDIVENDLNKDLDCAGEFCLRVVEETRNVVLIDENVNIIAAWGFDEIDPEVVSDWGTETTGSKPNHHRLTDLGVFLGWSNPGVGITLFIPINQ